MSEMYAGVVLFSDWSGTLARLNSIGNATKIVLYCFCVLSLYDAHARPVSNI